MVTPSNDARAYAGFAAVFGAVAIVTGLLGYWPEAAGSLAVAGWLGWRWRAERRRR